MAASELKPARFREQLALERSRGLVREVEGEGVLDAVGGTRRAHCRGVNCWFSERGRPQPGSQCEALKRHLQNVRRLH
jgi:hypothetical protein